MQACYHVFVYQRGAGKVLAAMHDAVPGGDDIQAGVGVGEVAGKPVEDFAVTGAGIQGQGPGVAVTTISRAVGDKWIDTHRGILPLRMFFVHGTTTDDGEEVAWNKIKIELQKLIDNEDKSKPLSDDVIKKRLGEMGFPVARRTVAKYREKLNIPSSRQRRDWTKK